mmetsp:Transcript_34146/g.90229  ORF Transcript_34146/g.90229 Transcript_34146/m.90229 type:complete len:174 (-) Transcript_34146:286-807(-)
MARYKLTYFDFPGVAEKIRIAFRLGGIDFEDDRIDFARWPEFKARTPYGLLPLLSVDGNAPMTQSSAILRYIGRLTKLYPDDPEKALAVDEIIGLEEDFFRARSLPWFIGRNPVAHGHAANMPGEEAARMQSRLRSSMASNEIPRFLTFFEAKLAQSGLNESACHRFPDPHSQ